jgi:hypothetical protein
MTDIDLQIAESTDTLYWLYMNGVKVDGRAFDLKGRQYQQEIMRPYTAQKKTKHNEVIRKGSQIGITIGKVCEATHGALYGLYPQGIIFYFPNKTAVEMFSASRFKPFLEDNPDTIGKYMGKTDRVDIRRVGDVNIYFFGGGATARVGGDKKDSTSVRSTPADWVILDERDLFDDVMARQVNQRLGNSTIKRRTDIGTPTIPDLGIDLLYKKSDMRRWQIPCECGKFTCVETEFPRCVRVDSEKGHLVCVHCGKRIDSNRGNWVPDCPDRDVVGYWASQLLNPNCDLNLVLKQYADPEAYDLDEGEFYRTVLGIPFIDADDELLVSDVYACCTSEREKFDSQYTCAMGVDVNWPELNVVIGYPLDRNRHKIVKTARVKEWPDLLDLAKRYKVQSCVIDAQPERHKVTEFQKQAPFAVWICFYSEHLKTLDQWDKDNRVVKVMRTEIFDASHDLVKKPGRLQLPVLNEELKEYAHQMTRSVRVLETDQETGTKIYRYRARGDKQDHYRNATNYYLLASKRIGPPKPETPVTHKPITQSMEYSL